MTPQNALDALDNFNWTVNNSLSADYLNRATVETIRTALKQSSAEVVTVDELSRQIDIMPAEHLFKKYPNGLKIIRSEK